MTVKDILETLEWGPAPESDKFAREWLDEHGPNFGMYINGSWVKPKSGENFETHNPATGELLGTISQAGKTEVDAAVAAARAALPGWSSSPGHVRARYLYAIARQVQKHHRLLAVIETLDNGKPIRETRDADVPLVARHFYHHAGWAQLFDETFPGYGPVGVCGQVIPWNFPLLMLAWKIAPALAAGNTVVLKPAEFTSISALAFAAICDSIGLPPGVVNIVTGDGLTGACITEHEDIDKVAFTGSTEVGRIIRKATAGTGKGLTLELGGKSPFIVFEDADIDSAIEGLVNAIWFNQGQVCCAGSRLLVQESISEIFHQKLRSRMSKLRIGNPMDKAVDMGAIVDESQRKTIADLCQLGCDEGGVMWQPDTEMPDKGCFFPPTLFTNVSPSSTIVQEEIFGPVLVALTFRTHKEAIALANNTRYGLAGSVWSQDIDTALEVARSIRAGAIWVNCTNQFDANAGFGGYRESGFGREGGREGMFAYMRPVSKLAETSTTSKSGTNSTPSASGAESIDRTAKMYIGGKQKRPDGGYTLDINGPNGLVGEVGRGNRKDIRDAVEAACGATKWANVNAHSRAQVLYYIAENLEQRGAEYAARLSSMTGCSDEDAANEVADSVAEWFRWAAWCDKYDGAVHETTMHGLVLAVNEAVGVVGVTCPNQRPLHGFTRLVAPLLAMGNAVIAIPSESYPLSATDLYQVLETSDLPGGVLNIVTGIHSEFVGDLAAHDGVDSMWVGAGDIAEVQIASVTNMKRVWKAETSCSDSEMLRQATHVKNIWLPHGL
ncbi:MAG: aldehyde dehydrogenase family protein [Candidatus Thalassarchaeaceae archaeon]|jgi:aldehyde dehydrogenase (NAD+)|nr:aldehyde dehydrogenase family protein [Candidatus Thalassarchaeaceae archaeon]